MSRNERLVKRAPSHAQTGCGQQNTHSRHERHRRTDADKRRAVETKVTADKPAQRRRIDGSCNTPGALSETAAAAR